MFKPYPTVGQKVFLCHDVKSELGIFTEGHVFVIIEVEKGSSDPWFYLKDGADRTLRCTYSHISIADDQVSLS